MSIVQILSFVFLFQVCLVRIKVEIQKESPIDDCKRRRLLSLRKESILGPVLTMQSIFVVLEKIL